MERRLDALEARFAPPPPPSAPRAVREPIAVPSTSFRPAPTPDLESLIGSRWLPRAGAVAIVTAVAYLVKLGLDRDTITPTMVAIGIAVACLAIVALGFRLRDEREAYGHVLVGIGAGGLYVDAVGAHFAQGILSAEAMVGTCAALGLAMLGYGALRALPAFLGIGLFGGLLAAAMPLSRGLSEVPVALFLLVATPAFAVVSMRRWPLPAMGVWAACASTALGFLFLDGPFVFRLIPIDAALLLGLAAYAKATEGGSIDDRFPFFAVATTAPFILGVAHGFGGAIHAAALGVALAAAGRVVLPAAAGRIVVLAGATLALVLAPLALPGTLPALFLAGSSLATVAFFRRRFTMLAAAQAVFSLGALAVASFLAEVSQASLPAPIESGLLALVGLAAIAAAWAMDVREARLGAGLAVWGLATRMATVGLDLPNSAAATAAWIATFVGLLAVGFARRLPELRQLGLAVAGATALKVVLVDLAGLDSALKAIILLGLGFVLLVGGYAYVRAGRAKGNLDA